MRLSCPLLVVAATLLASGNALSTTTTSDQHTLSKTGDNDGPRRLRRALKTIHAASSKESEEEERGNNFFNMIDDVFNPKTAEQLRKRAISQDTDEFYSALLRKVDKRAERFAGWKRDQLSYDQIRRFMEYNNRSEDEILSILAKYKHFIRTGKVE